MLSKRNELFHCVHTQCFHSFVHSEFTLAHCHFASKSHSGKASVKKNYTVWSVYSPNSSGKCLWCSLLNGQCYIQPVHFQNGLPLFCVVKCLPVYKRPTLLENHPGGFGIQTLNGITLPFVPLWDLARTREVGAFSSICAGDIIKPCFEADVFFFLFVSRLDTMRNNKKKASKNGLIVSLSGPILCPWEAHPMEIKHCVHSTDVPATPHTPQQFFHTVIICNCLHARDFIDNEFPGH